jgi:hypothetical protein
MSTILVMLGLIDLFRHSELLVIPPVAGFRDPVSGWSCIAWRTAHLEFVYCFM